MTLIKKNQIESFDKSDVWLSNVENTKVNLIATTAPWVTDDSDSWYSILSRWADITADKEYVALDVSVWAAVWK